jgi:hypothetical protein
MLLTPLPIALLITTPTILSVPLDVYHGINLSTTRLSAVAVWATDACTTCVLMSLLALFAAGAVSYAHRVIQAGSPLAWQKKESGR